MNKIKCDNCDKFKVDFAGLVYEGNWKNICLDCDHKANYEIPNKSIELSKSKFSLTNGVNNGCN